ncbi:SprT family protein [Cytobacillus spongiae]|jgi:SprT-like protein|uniref:SprT family protein n=1 Tax=Cytobacillus spongiae TaxID=2901381 RepID=UPI001F2D5996|nr:SprT family protein [Cytobacillus spongiae]UII56226.1 SprT family protein [Cytobacillus spongiae]
MEDKELQQLVEKISNDSFQKPFKHKAVFNARLQTTGGRYLLGSHNIEINRKYLEQIGINEVISIIKHELCHYHLHLEGKGYQHKDADFKLLLNQVGGARYCSTLPNRPTRKIRKTIFYMCEQCGTQYRRKKVINTSKYVCGKCRGKLIKVKELTVD